MPSDSIKYKYNGSALPGNAEVVVLLATAATSGSMSGVIGPPPNGVGNYFPTHNVHRVVVAMRNDQAGTLREYKSMDRGATWLVISSTAVAAAAANSQNIYDFWVEPYADWKLDWLNGAAPQTAFQPDISSTAQRVIAN